MTGHSVRQILADRKTKTRRLVKRPTVKTPRGRIETGCDACWKAAVPHNGDAAAFGGPCYLSVPACEHVGADGYPGGGRIWPRWNVGDRIWVRETFQPIWKTSEMPPNGFASPDGWKLGYPATDGIQEWHHEDDGLVNRCSSPLYMPRWASRLTLEVLDVRVERLTQITNEDVIAEGVPCWMCGGPIDGTSEAECQCFHTKSAARECFQPLWDSINKKTAPWESDPWVFVISFRRLQ